jgi:KDO2-lipid IV(A) lauroyltransferase
VPSRALRVYRAGSAFVRAVPGPLANGFARLAGTVAVPFAGERRSQVERNLRRIHGADFGGLAMRRAVVETFVSYARYYVESFRLPGTSPEVLDAGIRYEGWEEVVAARDEKGTGAIVALPHLGPWEWAGFWAATVLKEPITVVVEALEPHDLYEWFRELRESFGLHVIALGPGAGTQVLEALRRNHILVLLSDRDIGGGGVEVEFLGERTTLPAGPATLALRTGAPLFPSAVYAEGDHRVGIVRPALDTARRGKLRDDVQRITQDLADELGVLIRRAPEQWHLLQPNWPSDREQTGVVTEGRAR